MTDPVEELVATLETIRDGLRNLPASATAVQIDEIARLAISRFNAEMGDGVWVPREPTMEMTTFGPINAEDAFNEYHKTILRACGCGKCDQDAHDAFAAIYRAMIAASEKATPPLEREPGMGWKLSPEARDEIERLIRDNTRNASDLYSIVLASLPPVIAAINPEAITASQTPAAIPERK